MNFFKYESSLKKNKKIGVGGGGRGGGGGLV